MKQRILVLGAAFGLLAAPASFVVAQQAPGTATTAGIKAGTYQIDGAHSQVFASVMHMGFNPYFMLFGEATGSLDLNPQNLAASKVTVTVPVESVRTNHEELTQHLKKPDFFDAAKFPTLSFTSTSVKPTSATTADITGDLTVHGMTRPVTFKTNFTGQGPNPMTKAATVGFTAKGMIRRSDFGMGYGIPMVSDEVELKITAAFEQKAGS